MSRLDSIARVALAMLALAVASTARSDGAIRPASDAKLKLVARVEGECLGTEILPLKTSTARAATISQSLDVTYECTAGETPTIAIDGGKHFRAGTCRARALATASGTLACYEIEYGSSNDLAPNVATSLGTSATGTAQTVSLPFKITATAPGDYHDALEVTFSFS
jgi:spore coat protein U-like protein